MDSEQASRPQLSQRQHSSTHIVGGVRGGLRARNVSSKNLSKLGKLAVGHAGSKVSMARNTSKTNLRKNQSETSLQHDKRNRSSESPSKSERSSSITRRASATAAQVVASASSQRRTSASGSFIPEVNPIASFDPSRPVPLPTQPSKHRGKKRSSKDLSAGKKHAAGQPFEFDGGDEFDDEAWEDDNQEISTRDQAEMKIPDATYNYYEEDYDITHTEQNKAMPTSHHQELEHGPPAEKKQTNTSSSHRQQFEDAPKPLDYRDDREVDESEDDETQARLGQSNAESDSYDEREEVEEDGNDATQAKTDDPSQAEDDFQNSIRNGKKPIQASPRVTFQQHRRRIDAEASESEDLNSETRNITTATARISAAGPRSTSNYKKDAADASESQDSNDADSDTESSPDTVVLAPTTRKAPPSALKSPKSRPTEPTLSTDTSPVLTMKSAKKVQIEEPLDEIDVMSPSTSGAAVNTPSLPAARAISSKPITKPHPSPQYEFLSKAQRDRASLMQEAHPYPPSAWRDQFLSRVIPHVNDVNDVYTQKFTRRLDRRVEGRLNNVMETRDPLFDGLRRAQARGTLSGPEQNASTPAEPPRPSGIQGWFSRLGGGRKEEQKPQTKEEVEAERLERWSAMMGRYEWRVAQDEDNNRDKTAFYVDVES